jgi:uncharacterized damage-inducible protein DinB
MIRDVAPLPGYPEPYGLLCATLQDATAEWRGELPDDVPREAVVWRARLGGPSIGAIALHMIQAEISWMESFALRRAISDEDKRLLLWDEIIVDESRWPDPPNEPLNWYFDLHDRYRTRTLQAVREWPSAETVRESRSGNGCSLRWVLGHIIQHEAYHGGQIVMLHDLWSQR